MKQTVKIPVIFVTTHEIKKCFENLYKEHLVGKPLSFHKKSKRPYGDIIKSLTLKFVYLYILQER